MKNPYQNIWGKGKVGKGTRLAALVDIGGEVGNNCVIGCFVSIPPGIELEDEVFVGPGVNFANDKKPKIGKPWKSLKTLVKKGAVIGMNATIGPGIIIGENAIIGMGAVVLKNVKNNEIVVGNPATSIKKNDKSIYL